VMRVIIVDDEPLARKRLRVLLGRHSDVIVVAECGSGTEAVTAVDQHDPDALFLDVQMPGLSGFDVIAAVGERMPLLIFTTAYDQYALRAFEVHALDYLLKPFDEARLFAAVERAATFSRRERVFLEQLKPMERFVVRTPGRIVFLSLEDVDAIEAAGNYVYVHAGRERHLVRGTLKSMEGRLDPRRFARIHRGAIVNVERIAALEPRVHGDAAVILRGGARLVASRNFAAALRRRLPPRP